MLKSVNASVIKDAPEVINLQVINASASVTRSALLITALTARDVVASVIKSVLMGTN